jgi:glycine/D-amino acid oxidase-like deaminating enzyme
VSVEADPDLKRPVQGRLYWPAGSLEPLPQTPIDPAVAYDLVIVGAGFTGLWAAWHAKKAGIDRVLVLDADSIGAGASSRNAGYLTPSFSASYSEMRRTLGVEKSAILTTAALDNVAEVLALIAGLDIECDLVPTGIVTVSTHPDFDGRIKRDVASAEAMGLPLTVLDREALRAQMSSPVLSSGYSVPGGIVNPRRLVLGLAQRLAERGTMFASNVEVVGVSDSGAELALDTSTGTVRAHQVFFAQNAWAHQNPRFKRTVLPVYSYQAATRQLSGEELDRLEWRNKDGYSDRRSILLNFRLTEDGRIIFGGRDIVQPYGGRISTAKYTDYRILALLQESFKYVFPMLPEVDFEATWGGVIALTADHLPSVGIDASRRIAYAHGCGGHGVTQSHLWSGAAIDLLTGVDSERTRLPFIQRREARYPPEPMRYIGGAATRRQLRSYDDRIQAGLKGDKEPPFLRLASKLLNAR